MVFLPARTPVRPPAPAARRGVRERRKQRRELADQDRRAAVLAERHLLGVLLAEASDLVRAGWAQDCWFVATDRAGATHRIGPGNLDELADRTIADVCLVGAIVQAGGGVAHAGSQPVHRALDLTWATLHNQRVQWCPSPTTRLAHVNELTRWNDQAGRQPGEVAGLLDVASRRASGYPLDV